MRKLRTPMYFDETTLNHFFTTVEAITAACEELNERLNKDEYVSEYDAYVTIAKYSDASVDLDPVQSSIMKSYPVCMADESVPFRVVPRVHDNGMVTIGLDYETN